MRTEGRTIREVMHGLDSGDGVDGERKREMNSCMEERKITHRSMNDHGTADVDVDVDGGGGGWRFPVPVSRQRQRKGHESRTRAFTELIRWDPSGSSM